jgi:hypothetical protein
MALAGVRLKANGTETTSTAHAPKNGARTKEMIELRKFLKSLR